MRRPRGTFAVRACEFQAASMADLGFLLLIFVVLATVFAIEQGTPLGLPGSERAGARLNGAHVLEIHAQRDGTITAGGAVVLAAGVRGLVESRLAHNPDLAVILATAPDASYGVMLHVLDQIQQARCRNISVRTLE
jgi:biopolymer transport protein ExbD